MPKLDGFKPIGSMYGIFIYIWLKFMVNVGKYAIHGSYGKYSLFSSLFGEMIQFEEYFSDKLKPLPRKIGCTSDNVYQRVASSPFYVFFSIVE